tara:strand:+ start:55 stop:603 length:549 start_codon:yes stop_codon:yes gene_type:complete
MKKISLLLIVITTTASAQLRIGMDISRNYKSTLGGTVGEALGLSSNVKTDKATALTLGYEQMLLSLIGVGVEYTSGSSKGGGIPHEDASKGHQFVFGYAVAKIPVGMPMFRGIVRAGMSLPLGGQGSYGLGPAFGGGLRFKLPLFPVGAELLYTIHNLKPDTDEALFDMSYRALNLTATYSF